MKLYGIKNCTTVKAALQWLAGNHVPFEFHDYKSKGITEEKLRSWCEQVGWENLLNKKGTTWRQLPPSVQQRIVDESAAIELMLEKTSVIRRPLVERSNKVVALGFDEVVYRKLL